MSSAPTPRKVLRAEHARFERLTAKTKAANPIDAVVEREAQQVWSATRRGERIRICALHLLADPTLVDVAPGAGSCDRCTELVLPTRHAVARWLERVGGRTTTEAAQQILEFVRTAYTAQSSPKWLRTPTSGVELLLNVRWSKVGLVKRRGTRGAGFSNAIIATVLTSAGPKP